MKSPHNSQKKRVCVCARVFVTNEDIHLYNDQCWGRYFKKVISYSY